MVKIAIKIIAACAMVAWASASFSHVVQGGADLRKRGNSTKGLKAPAVLLEVLDVQAAGVHAH